MFSLGSCPSIKIMVFSLNFSDPAASADLAVILMQEGLAHVLLVGKRYARFHRRTGSFRKPFYML